MQCASVNREYTEHDSRHKLRLHVVVSVSRLTAGLECALARLHGRH